MFDSKRTAEGMRTRDSVGEGRMAANVGLICKKRLAGTGRWTACGLCAARGVALRVKARMRDDVERMAAAQMCMWTQGIKKEKKKSRRASRMACGVGRTRIQRAQNS